MSAKEEPNNKKVIIITLECSDGEIFDVDEAFADKSPAIKLYDYELPILFPFSSTILRKVLEYYEKHHHVKAAPPKRYEEDDLKTWDLEFVKVDKDTLYDLIQAATFLKFKSLMLLTFQTFEDNIMELKTTKEYCKILSPYTERGVITKEIFDNIKIYYEADHFLFWDYFKDSLPTQEEGQCKSILDAYAPLTQEERLDLGDLDAFLKAAGFFCPRVAAENLDFMIELMSGRRPEDQILDQIPSEDELLSRPLDGLNMDE